MKTGVVLLFTILVCLQYKLWLSDVGIFTGQRLEQQLEQHRIRVDMTQQRNRLLRTEVMALKNGLEAVEARARTDLGMIKEGEVFYLVPDDRL
ncbi:MAG: septum formation initiator family protein [Proteobacteria bacterium]|nr:septum formation initiator family protein [Pseudomonadota bacterium]